MNSESCYSIHYPYGQEIVISWISYTISALNIFLAAFFRNTVEEKSVLILIGCVLFLLGTYCRDHSRLAVIANNSGILILNIKSNKSMFLSWEEVRYGYILRVISLTSPKVPCLVLSPTPLQKEQLVRYIKRTGILEKTVIEQVVVLPIGPLNCRDQEDTSRFLNVIGQNTTLVSE